MIRDMSLENFCDRLTWLYQSPFSVTGTAAVQ